MCPCRRSKFAGLAYLCLFYCDEFVVIKSRKAAGFIALADAPAVDLFLERGFVRGPAGLEQIDLADKFRLGRIGQNLIGISVGVSARSSTSRSVSLSAP